MTTRCRPGPLLALIASLFAALAPTVPGIAQERGAAPPAVVVEARFVDRATGAEAQWGATGQVLLPPPTAVDPSLAHWRGARAVATSPARQSVAVATGGTATLRVGREVPFAGWFLRIGMRGGFVETGAQWREVETLIGVEVLAAEAGGRVRLALTPEFGYLQGRSRRSAAFPDLRVVTVLEDGREALVGPAPAAREFFDRFLAGYDPLRRVRAVDLLLRASVVGTPTP